MKTESVEYKSTSELEHVHAFKAIRNYLAGQFVGATRDSELMNELFKCIFAKHYILNGLIELSGDTYSNYQNAFSLCKKRLFEIFAKTDTILLDAKSINTVDYYFNQIDLESNRADILSELYEAFGDTTVKSAEGQFFTPAVAVQHLVNSVAPKKGSLICDPACGAGGFLISVAKNWNLNCENGVDYTQNIYGYDKDSYLVKMAKARLALLTNSLPSVICADSLALATESGIRFKPPQFDYIFTNPPFGSKIVAASPETLSHFDLGKKWKHHTSGEWQITDTIVPNTPPQVLFLERCIHMLKPGGTFAAILPESLISSKSYSHVVEYLKSKMHIDSIVGMPENLFKTSGKGGTHTKTVALIATKDLGKKKYTYIADAKFCGHDSRGRNIEKNDVPLITAELRQHLSGKQKLDFKEGRLVLSNELGANLAPRKFETLSSDLRQMLCEDFDFIKISELVSLGQIQINTGDEVGKLAYGTGEIPFIRTSDISNWEIKSDPKHRVSETTFNQFSKKQDVRENDLMIVRDGTYLIGTIGLVTREDLPLIYQSHIYKVRVLSDNDSMNPFLFLASFSSDFVKMQIKKNCISQDIIDSLGDKIYELELPIPKSKERRKLVSKIIKESVEHRIEARKLKNKISSIFTP